MRLGSDERLARRAQKGDLRAFEAIYRRYHQDLYRFCLSLVGDPQDAEDALQSTMFKAMRALPGDRRQIQLRPWLYRIARNESIEALRRRRDRATLEPELLPSGRETAETVEAREHLRRLIADLAELPERQRAALVMRELAGLGFSEIAASLETSPATARQTVYEARLSLRQMEAGREMKCKKVMWELSEADGRVTRRREIQAHLRSCPECRAFQDAITRRRGELGALAPLPVAASAGLLESVLGTGQVAASGGLAGAGGTAVGKVAATSAIAKSAATVAIVAAVGVTAADRGGVIDVPLGDRDVVVKEAPAPGDSPLPIRAGASPSSGAVTGRARLEGDRVAPPGQGRAAPGGGRAIDDPSSEPGPKGRAAQPVGAAPGRSHGATGAAHGKAEGWGRSSGLPAAASHGQQTAAGHKDPRANQSPGEPSSPTRAKPTAKPSPSSPSTEPRAPVRSDPDPTAPVSPASEKSGSAPQGGKPTEAAQP